MSLGNVGIALISLCIMLQEHKVSAGNYKVVLTELTFDDAEAYCQSTYGTNLASVLSGSDNSKILSLISASGSTRGGWWVGGLDRNVEGTFEWNDGSSFSYTNWGTGEPNNNGGTEDCIQFRTGIFRWNDAVCSVTQPFVCNLITNPPTFQPTAFPTIGYTILPIDNIWSDDLATGIDGWLPSNIYNTYIHGFWGTNDASVLTRTFILPQDDVYNITVDFSIVAGNSWDNGDSVAYSIGLDDGTTVFVSGYTPNINHDAGSQSGWIVTSDPYREVSGSFYNWFGTFAVSEEFEFDPSEYTSNNLVLELYSRRTGSPQDSDDEYWGIHSISIEIDTLWDLFNFTNLNNITNITFTSEPSREYSLTIRTGTLSLCPSDSVTLFEVTLTNDDDESVSTTFYPSRTHGGSVIINFDDDKDIGTVTDIKFDVISGDNGWCFDYFTLLLDTNDLWISCTTDGYNSYNVIAIDSNVDMGYDATTDITLDVRQESSTLNCDFFLYSTNNVANQLTNHPNNVSLK